MAGRAEDSDSTTPFHLSYALPEPIAPNEQFWRLFDILLWIILCIAAFMVVIVFSLLSSTWI